MRQRALRASLIVAAGAFAVAACGNPEKSAEKAIEKASADWAAARDDLDPQKRVKSYDSVIKAVEDVGKKYKKTPYGMAVANGGSAGGVSITAMKAERDALDARAKCYADPTAECLRPFASSSYRDNAGYENSPEAAFGRSQELVCDKNFAAADQSLESFKINRALYAQQLMQIALAAAQCDKPEEVKAAVAAYIQAEPAQGPERMSALLSILATDALEPAWPPVLSQFETILASGALDQQSAANIALTMAVDYAKLGDSEKALAKYAYFTETLGYQADWQSKLNLASNLIIAGHAAEGLKVVETNGQKTFLIIPLHEAAEEVALRLGLVRTGTGVPEFTGVADIKDYMAPVDGATKARYAPAADAIEAEIDKLAPAVIVQDGAIGPSGLDTAYGILALIHQKLGDSGKASGAINKAVGIRAKLLAPGAEGVGEEDIAEYQSALALAQGKPEEAASYAKVVRVRHEHSRLIMKEIARTGDAEKALAVANELGAASNWNQYSVLVEGLVESGKIDKAEAVINAYPGNPDEKKAFQWLIVQKLAAEGDAKGAQEAANKYSLLNTPADRMRLATNLLNSQKVAGDRKKAEPVIREIFAIGEELDKSGNYNDYVAQNAAAQAFQHGYTDLGVELYKAASKKDQRPLFAAFSDEAKPKELTPIFMLAQDNLAGEELGYVIDAGIRKLEKQSS